MPVTVNPVIETEEAYRYMFVMPAKVSLDMALFSCRVHNRDGKLIYRGVGVLLETIFSEGKLRAYPATILSSVNYDKDTADTIIKSLSKIFDNLYAANKLEYKLKFSVQNRSFHTSTSIQDLIGNFTINNFYPYNHSNPLATIVGTNSSTTYSVTDLL